MPLPGAFPGDLSLATPRAARAAHTAAPVGSLPAPLLLHTTAANSKRNAQHRQHLCALLDLLATTAVVVCFLWDYNLLLFGLRIFVQWLVLTPPEGNFPRDLLTARTLYQWSLLCTVAALVVHAVWGAPLPRAGEHYLFGHFTVQLIGEVPAQRWMLLAADLLVWVLTAVCIDVLHVHHSARVGSETTEVDTIQLGRILGWWFLRDEQAHEAADRALEAADLAA